MKKLIAMIGAVAMSFGLFADATSFTTSFEDGEDGVVGTTFTPGDAGWSGITEDQTLKAYDDDTDPAYEYGTTDRRFAGTNSQYLPLETEKTATLEHEITEGNIFVDQLVRFTGFEDPQTNLVEGTKIAVWMSEFFNDEGTEATTNLYVTVGSDKTTDQIAVKLSGTYEIGKWYRLTIKALGNIFVEDQQLFEPRAGFSIWVDGVKKAIDKDDPNRGTLLSDGASGFLNGTAASAYAAFQLFPAITSGADQIALKSFGYNGIGAVDDIYVDEEGPEFAKEVETVDVTFAPITGAVVTKVIDSEGKEFDHPTAPITVKPGVLTVTLVADEGYKMKGDGEYIVNTADAEDGVITIDAEDDFAEVVATVTNGQKVDEYAEDELYDMIVGLVEDDEVSFWKSCTIKNEDEDDLYEVASNTTITVGEDAASWTVFVGNDDEDLSNDFIDYVGAPDGISKTFTFESEEGVLSLYGDVEGVVEVTAGCVDVFEIEVSGLLKADADEETFWIEEPITLVGDGKVMVKTDDDSVKDMISADEGDVDVTGPDEDGWFTYQISGVPPVPPAESGFMIMIGETETYFDYLQDAIDAASDGDTITAVAPLLTQKGVFVAANKFPTEGLTIDLSGLDYIVDKPGAGDSGTETQAFHFKSGNIITIKDGQISCPASMKDYTWPNPGDVKGIARMLNNYGTLTLENVDIDASNMAASFYGKGEARHAGDSWAVSAAKTGDLTLTGGSSITSREAAQGYASYAFDTDTGVSVTLNDATIYGDVQLAAGNLTLTAGTIDGELVAAPGVTLGTVTKSADFDVNAPAGWFWDNNVLARCAAEIDGTYYNTLAAAFTAALADDVIVLLKDVELEAPIAVDKKVTLNIGDFDITPKAAFTRPTGSKITIDAMFAVRYGGDFTVVGGEGVIDSSAYPTIYSPIKMTEYGESYDGSTKAKLTVDANLKGYYYAITGNGKRSGTEITINGGLLEGTIVDESAGIYHPQGGTLTINGGTIKGDTGLYIKAGDCICSVGSGATIIATGTKKDYVAMKSGFQSTGDAFLIDNADYPGGEPSADIEGGEFVSAHGAAVASYAKAGFDPIVGFVEGGTFTGAVKIDDAIAGGDYAFGPFTPGEPQTLVDAVAKVNDVNYATLAAALDAAVEGDTVTLLADIALNDTLDIEKSVEIDLNEKTVTFGAQVNKGISAVDVDQLTIKNGTITVADSRTNISLSRAIYLLHTSAVFEDLIVDLPGFEYVINVDCDTEPDSDCWNKPLAYTLDCENVVVNGNGSLFHIENAEATLTACAATFDTTLPSFGGAHEAAIYSSCGAVTTVDGGLFTAPNALQTGNYGGDIIVKNGVFNGNIKSWMLDNDTRDFADVNKANIQIEKGMFTGNFVYADGCSAESPLLTVVISGGDFSDTNIPVKFIEEKEGMTAYWADSEIEDYVTPAWKETVKTFTITYVDESGHGIAPDPKTVTATEVEEGVWQYVLVSADLPKLTPVDPAVWDAWYNQDGSKALTKQVITDDITLTANWKTAVIRFTNPNGDVSYATGITPSNSGTYELLNDHTTTGFTIGAIKSNQEVIIDLGGHTLTLTQAGNIPVSFNSNYKTSTVTFTNGTITAVSNSKEIVLSIKGTSNTVNFANDFTLNCGAGNSIVIEGTGCTLNTEATIATTGKAAAIQTNGSSTKTATINVKGGSITSENLAIYAPGDQTLNISGGTITGSTAVEIRAGALNVTGGTLIATAEEYTVTPNSSGSTTRGAAVAVAQHTTKKAIDVSIEDATLTGVKAVSVANPQENDSENVGVVLGEATYNGELAFSADGNATVANDGAEIAAPAGYGWNSNGVLVKEFTVTYKVEDVPDAFEKVLDGETLKNIPVPAAKTGYTGSWDVTPMPTTVITADTTFTYTYTANTYAINYTWVDDDGAQVAPLANTLPTEFTFDGESIELKAEMVTLTKDYKSVAFEPATVTTDVAAPFAVTIMLTKAAPEYPSDWPATDAETKAKFAEWVAGKGAGAQLDTDAAKNAFLLNCTVDEEPTEAAAFKITAFTGTKESVVTPTANTKGDDFNGAVTVKAFSDVACTTEVEPASQAALFFKAFLDFPAAK